MANEIWRLPKVLGVVSLARSTIYGMVARGEFPAPIRLGVRAVGWRKADVVAWLDARDQSGRR